jgi:uncharacterized OB-fold protein
MNETMQGFRITKCGRCGKLYFPSRLICRVCGGHSWVEETIHDAVIEESTMVAHVIGGQTSGPRHLATVRGVGGLRLIVGLEAPLPDGTHVLLCEKDGAPIAGPAQ